MFGYYGLYGPAMWILIPAIIFTMAAQARVSSTFRKYSSVRSHRHMTGAEAARVMLDANGLRDVKIERVRGSLTDHYDPRHRVLRLSETVYGVDSVAAVSVACHEAGHALQHAYGYVPLKFRNSIVPLVNFAANLSWPLAVFGLMLLMNGSYMGDMLFNIGVIAMAAVIIFHLVTLPVEFNASSRAVENMENLGIISVESDEDSKARSVLRAAAMTYVASLAMAIANLVRMLAMRGNRE